MAPLWVARIAKLHRKVSKIKVWPPLCKLGIRFDFTKGMLRAFLPGYGQKMGRNLSEDFFFFEKWDKIWVRQFKIQIFVLLKFSEVSAPPLFKILRTLLHERLKSFNFGSPVWGRNPSLIAQNFFKFYLSLIFTLLWHFMCLTLEVKKFEFWRTHLGETPIAEHPFLLGLRYF